VWITINEPNVLLLNAYFAGRFPPGETERGSLNQVVSNLLRAHAAAYTAIHEIQENPLVGLAHQHRGMVPATSSNFIHRFICNYRSRIFNELFPIALVQGDYKLFGQKTYVPEVVGTQDFFGVNYYTTEHVAFSLRSAGQLFSRGFYPPEADLSETGFIANEPEGFGRALKWAVSFGLPVYVLENGVEDAKDSMRLRYLCQHILQVWRAVNFNWPILGYFHWTLVDNFEWERGWTQRFGLWELDVDSQERRKRRSVDLYGDVCSQNCISTEMVSEYAPEVFEELFPV
jgi:beta-glucosidase